MTTRRFKLLRPLTLPLELYAAPGAEYHRPQAGDEIDIDAERCRKFDRFIRGRIRAEDMKEIETPATPKEG